MIRNIFERTIKNKDINLEIACMEDVDNFICLSDLQCGKHAEIRNLYGNSALIDKLKAMGIFVGAVILKKSAFSGRGPVIVEKGNMQFALGYDIAKKIVVKAL